MKRKSSGTITAATLLTGCALTLGPAAYSVGATGPVDGSFVVTLNLAARLTGLDAAIAGGSWSCSARVMRRAAIDAEIAKINALTGKAAREEFSSALEYRAHYLSQQATAEFRLSSGAYTGNHAIVLKISGYDLTDQQTHRVIDNPAVMMGCWLYLSTGAGRQEYAYQATSVGARSQDVLLQVSAVPYVLLVMPIPNQS